MSTPATLRAGGGWRVGGKHWYEVVTDGNHGFWVGTVRRQGAGKWEVDGRAYEDIYVGDVLVTDAALRPGAEQCPRFTVLSITAYRRELPVLSQAVTGTLVLGGEHGERLKEARMLYKAPPAGG